MLVTQISAGADILEQEMRHASRANALAAEPGAAGSSPGGGARERSSDLRAAPRVWAIELELAELRHAVVRWLSGLRRLPPVRRGAPPPPPAGPPPPSLGGGGGVVCFLTVWGAALVPSP